jgi:ABC-2 type transport system ATP-binding protein
MIASFNNVTKHYSSGEGVSELSFSVDHGQVIGLLGLNGSGKTTTMKIIAGLLRPQSGSVEVMGKAPRAGRRHIAFLGDRQSFPSWMTPKDMLNFMVTFYADFQTGKFHQLIKELDIPGKPLEEMSKGQRQKLKLVATMARKSDLYLLDEPLSGIDLVARTGILKTLMAHWNEESSVMVSTHEIKDVDPYLDRAIFLNNGYIKADESAEDIRIGGQSVADRFLELMGGSSS